MKRSLAILLVAAAGVLPGCGGGGSSPTTPSGPPPPVRTQIGQGTFTLASVQQANRAGLPFDSVRADFSTNATGTLDINVDWTNSTSTIGFAVYRGSCSFQQFYADQCSEVATTAINTSKPKTLSIPSLAAGGYTLIIASASSVGEAGSFQIFLTR